MISQIDFCSRLEAEAFLQTASPKQFAVVSITDPGQRAPLRGWQGELFRMEFLDVIPGEEQAGGESSQSLSLHDAQLLTEYLRELDARKSTVRLLIHCEFGASRSAAVALYAEALTGADLPRRYLAFGANRHVLDVLQAAWPVEPPAALPARLT